MVDITSLDLKGTIMVLATVAPFVLFVAGPRIVAGDTRAMPPWVVRFALFWAAPLVGARLWG